MTVKRFKELLNQFDDDDRIIIDNGDYNPDPVNEILLAFKVDGCKGIVLQTRGDFDISSELEARVEAAAKGEYYVDNEADFMIDLFQHGFTVEDFDYDPERYEWAKRTAKEYGLI